MTRRAPTSSAASMRLPCGNRRSARLFIPISMGRELPPMRRPGAGVTTNHCRQSTACRLASRTSSRLPTGMGSPLFDGWCSGRDAAAVAALREAGAVILGKTVTTEFATTEPRGTRNPWDLARTPGGSSSGSAAAVAAGLVSAALGTQVMGSIARPASYCGCVGFKPSVGAINRGGSHDELSQSCMGVLAATLEDAWQVVSEIAARAGGDPGYPGLVGPLRMPAPAKPN